MKLIYRVILYMPLMCLHWLIGIPIQDKVAKVYEEFKSVLKQSLFAAAKYPVVLIIPLKKIHGNLIRIGKVFVMASAFSAHKKAHNTNRMQLHTALT